MTCAAGQLESVKGESGREVGYSFWEEIEILAKLRITGREEMGSSVSLSPLSLWGWCPCGRVNSCPGRRGPGRVAAVPSSGRRSGGKADRPRSLSKGKRTLGWVIRPTVQTEMLPPDPSPRPLDAPQGGNRHYADGRHVSGANSALAGANCVCRGVPSLDIAVGLGGHGELVL